MKTLVKVFTKELKGPLNERINSQMSSKIGNHWNRLRNKAIERLVKRKLASCLPFIESSIKHGTSISTFVKSRPKDPKLQECLLWGKVRWMYDIDRFIGDSIRERIERMVQ